MSEPWQQVQCGGPYTRDGWTLAAAEGTHDWTLSNSTVTIAIGQWSLYTAIDLADAFLEEMTHWHRAAHQPEAEPRWWCYLSPERSNFTGLGFGKCAGDAHIKRNELGQVVWSCAEHARSY